MKQAVCGIAVLFLLSSGALAADTASAQVDSEEADQNLWTYGYSEAAENHTSVTGVPAAAASGFRGQGYGAACVLPPSENLCHEED